MKCNKMSSAYAYMAALEPLSENRLMKPLKISKMYFDLRLNLIGYIYIFLIFLRDFFLKKSRY